MSEGLDTCYRIFTELEGQRADTLAELIEWSPDRVSYRPNAGSWSAIEVLDHIVRVETGTMVAVRNGLHNPHPLGTEHRPGIAALDRALRSDQSFQVPPGAEEILPDRRITLRQVAQRWVETREGMGRLVTELAPDQVGYGVFCHPFAGWMTFPEVLNHFSAHFYHHGFQLARLRVSSAYLVEEVRIERLATKKNE